MSLGSCRTGHTGLVLVLLCACFGMAVTHKLSHTKVYKTASDFVKDAETASILSPPPGADVSNSFMRFAEIRAGAQAKGVQSSGGDMPGSDGTVAKSIAGSIRLNGMNYMAQCDCAVPSGNLSEAGCTPSTTIIRTERKGKPLATQAANPPVSLSQDAILKNFIPSVADAVPVSVSDQMFVCNEALSEVPVVATPGGDIGDFILSLTEYEMLIQSMGVSDYQLTQEQIEQTFDKWLDYMPRAFMYMHTTATAAQNLWGSASPPTNTGSDFNTWIQKADNPIYIGCKHLAAMVSPSGGEQYSVRSSLAGGVIKAFYKKLVLQTPGYKKLKLEITADTTVQTAYVEIRTGRGCNQAGMTFAIPTKKKVNGKDAAIFLDHLDASVKRKEEYSAFFSQFAVLQGAAPQEEILRRRIVHHFYGWVSLTSGVLDTLGTFPFYSVAFK
eukprot:GILK01000821.1.p1 GENE.GILK01000821.1~~GILK01000821.1.p1  ORF type:complete len:441 (-),score=67.08 GILK01000821.1:247-1569(-)